MAKWQSIVKISKFMMKFTVRTWPYYKFVFYPKNWSIPLIGRYTSLYFLLYQPLWASKFIKIGNEMHSPYSVLPNCISIFNTLSY